MECCKFVLLFSSYDVARNAFEKLDNSKICQPIVLLPGKSSFKVWSFPHFKMQIELVVLQYMGFIYQEQGDL